MNIPPPSSRHRPNASISLPTELISEVLSHLTVKHITQLRCVSKSWNSLISDPFFVNLHHKKSAQNPNLAIVTGKIIESCVIPLPISRLLENPQISISLQDDDPTCYQMEQTVFHTVIMVGACNGLICFVGYAYLTPQSWLCFWNPATRKMSNIVWYSRNYDNGSLILRKLVFGYDNLSDTYKVVALRLGFLEVKVFSSSDNVWRNIQNFPVFPYYHMKDGVYLNGSVNWFVIRKNLNSFVYDSRVVTVEQFVIVSLDLGTETFTQMLPPRSFDFDGVPSFEPALCVLMDCLCYCHDFKESYFVIWQMKEFGVQESWTQFLKISYHNLEIYFDFRHLYLLPLCLSGDTLILTNDQERQAILYNWKDNRVERTKITNRTWWSSVKGYVESLFSYH